VGTRAFGGAVQSEYRVKKSHKKKIDSLWREKAAAKKKTKRKRRG
jgi:predicted GIY-YIG superfamily endonuclease